MQKDTNNLKIKLLPTLNRGIIYTAFPIGQPVPFTILFNKQSSALQFAVDTQSEAIQQGKIFTSMYRNLNDCKFCKLFFQLQSTKDERYDYRFKFSGVNRYFERDAFRFSKEKLDLQLPDQKKSSNNYLLVLGWKLYDIEDDLIFFFVQRRCYNHILHLNILRTMGLQFATERALEALDKYEERYSTMIRKVPKVEFLDNEDNIKNLKLGE